MPLDEIEDGPTGPLLTQYLMTESGLEDFDIDRFERPKKTLEKQAKMGKMIKDENEEVV